MTAETKEWTGLIDVITAGGLSAIAGAAKVEINPAVRRERKERMQCSG
ncbi:hypothetical protein [Hwanghaeella grinnelliae]|nr:hypothetical protein [Hwanghaeella grinnelliae]